MLNNRFKVIVLWCAAVCSSPFAYAQGSVFIEELTTQEISQALKAGKTTVLIPIGGTEQNGPHMVLGKHNVRAKVLAGKIAAGLGNALVAPVLAYTPEGNIDPPTEHMGFAGTISISDDAFKSVLLGAARSFQKHGFLDVVLLGDSGNYQKLLSQAADAFNRQAGKSGKSGKAGESRARAHHPLAYYQAVQTTYVDALKAKGLSSSEIGSHAGAADTSLAMAVDVALVKPERFAEAVRLGKSGGTLGDPRASTAANGQMGVDAVVKMSVDVIKQVVSAPR